MTSQKVEQGPHIDDGDLIRLYDGECTPEEKERLDAHLDACLDCRTTADSLKRASELFSSSVLELDTHVTARPKRELTFGKRAKRGTPVLRLIQPRVLRIAAVLALMVLVFTATPARAWLTQGWTALRSLVAPETVAVPDTPEESEVAPAGMSSILRFTPRTSEFRLEFTDYQAAGTLVLVIDSSVSASAGIIGEETGDEMILLPNGLRVRNSRGSLTSYEVHLPLTLSEVTVSVAGNTVLRLDVEAGPTPLHHELDLTEGGEN
jgi:hypothetical protein